MPTHFFSLTTLTQKFEDETFLAEAVNFHEISRFGSSEETVVFNVRLNAEQILKDDYANVLQMRIPTGEIEIREVSVEITPPKKSLAWRENVALTFHVLHSSREDGYLSAYVPALGIAVVSRKASEFDVKIKKEIVSALKRGGYLKSLKYLRWLDRIESVELSTEEIAVTLPTARQRAIAEEKDDGGQQSVLDQIGTDLTKSQLKIAYETEAQTNILAELLKTQPAAGVLLVGPAGVGKTAIFHELVREREKFGLGGQEFRAVGGAQLIAGQTGFGMWQERCQKLIDEAKKRRAILHLGNLIELFEVGKSSASTQGIASFLRPKIARGEISVVVECTPEQLPILERRDPNILSAFQQIKIEEPERKTSLKILESVAHEMKNKRAIEPAAVKTVEALHRRFSSYSAFPGRPVRFLRNLFQEAGARETITASTVFKAFSNETGLPEMLLNDEIPLELTEAEKFFAARVIGQPQAVTLVTKLIATIKAKLTRPRKPIASLLFIGPTGVGKTEMVKALAESFFSDKGRLIRFDMSEFSNPAAVQRLIGGTGEKEGLLTAKVREQPFSVVLLDEFEKADHSFFDLLLQMLGEGRLTDSAGRVADFTNSIIVMTSNLGASEFQRGQSGFMNNSGERETAVKHFDSAVKQFLRPEIYNRLDRIVPFAPLDEKTVLTIANLEIEKLKRRDGLRFRSIKIEIDDAALEHLAESGYDARYGARPLKRTIERELLAPLSAELNRRPADDKLTVTINVRAGRLAIEYAGENEPKKRYSDDVVLAAQAHRAARLRRQMQKFTSSYRLNELRDEIYQIVRMQALEKRGRWVSEEDRLRIERKPKLEAFLENIKSFGAAVDRLEDEILLEIYGKAANEDRKYLPEIVEKEILRQKYLFELLSLQHQNPNELRLSLFSENAAALFRLGRLYAASFAGCGCKVRRTIVFTSEKLKDQAIENKPLFEREVRRREIDDFDKFMTSAPQETLGILMEITGPLALPRYASETGIHSFAAGLRSDPVLAGVIGTEFDKFELPEELAKRDSVKTQPERRFYETVLKQIKDPVPDKMFSFEHSDLQTTFIKIIEETLQNTAENLIA